MSYRHFLVALLVLIGVCVDVTASEWILKLRGDQVDEPRSLLSPRQPRTFSHTLSAPDGRLFEGGLGGENNPLATPPNSTQLRTSLYSELDRIAESHSGNPRWRRGMRAALDSQLFEVYTKEEIDKKQEEVTAIRQDLKNFAQGTKNNLETFVKATIADDAFKNQLLKMMIDDAKFRREVTEILKSQLLEQLREDVEFRKEIVKALSEDTSGRSSNAQP